MSTKIDEPIAQDAPSVDPRARIPLEDAVFAFGDPAQVARYQALLKQCAGLSRRHYRKMNGRVVSRKLDGSPIDVAKIEQTNRLLDDLDAQYKELWEAHRAKLRVGELIASGYSMPRSIDARERDLPDHFWDMLQFQKNNVVAGNGLEVVKVRVRRALQISESVSGSNGPTQESQRPTEVGKLLAIVPVAGKRKTKKTHIPLFADELHRLAMMGTLRQNWGLQARDLLKWFEAAHDKETAPTPKTLRNRLKKLFDELRNRPIAR